MAQFHSRKVTPHKATPKSSHIHSGWEQGVPLPILIFIMNFFWDTLYRTRNKYKRKKNTYKKEFFYWPGNPFCSVFGSFYVFVFWNRQFSSPCFEKAQEDLIVCLPRYSIFPLQGPTTLTRHIIIRLPRARSHLCWHRLIRLHAANVDYWLGKGRERNIARWIVKKLQIFLYNQWRARSIIQFHQFWSLSLSTQISKWLTILITSYLCPTSSFMVLFSANL